MPLLIPISEAGELSFCSLCLLAEYLVPAGQAASTLIPGDGVGGLAGHQAVEVQGMSVGQGGRGGLDADGVHHALGWEGET